MIKKVFTTEIQAPVQALWDFHASAEALKALVPPGTQVELGGEDLSVRNGTLHVLHLTRFGFLKLTWRARISEVTPPTGFTDVAEQSPFAYWRHRHEFIDRGAYSVLEDTVEYRLPLGPLGQIANALFVSQDIDAMFRHRHEVTRRLVESPLGLSEPPKA